MKKIRIQNDIRITWRIYRMGEEEVLEGKNINVKLYNAYNKPSPITYTYEGNVVTVLFEGRNQEVLGDYTLVLTENAGSTGMVTIDKVKCFSLVKHSNEECGCPVPSCDVESFHLASDIDIPSNGLSAYEIWLRNGHAGSEEDFLEWLRRCVEISEDGIMTDSQGRKWQLTPYIEPPHIVSVTYDEPVVKLTYPKISYSGGTVTPTLSYSQIKRTLWSDGREETETITSGATLEWSEPNGKVTAESTTSMTEQTVKTVTLTLTINGYTVTTSYAVKQSAYVEPLYYYVGDVVSSTAKFPETDLTGFNKKTYTSNQQHFTATKNCFVLLLPDTLAINAISYTDGGIKTTLEVSDFTLVHDDVTLEGIRYKVYGYRFGAVDADSPLTYDYTLKKL